MPGKISRTRKSEVIDFLLGKLVARNRKWQDLLDVIRERSLASPPVVGPIGSEEIAGRLGQNDRTVRDDSSRIRDLVDAMFEYSNGLFKVQLNLPDGRPRQHEYGRLYTFEIVAAAQKPDFHIHKFFWPLTPYIAGDESLVDIVHPGTAVWIRPVQQLTAVLAAFGCRVTEQANSKWRGPSSRDAHLIALGEKSADAFGPFSIHEWPLLAKFKTRTEPRKVFAGRTSKGSKRFLMALLGRDADVIPVVDYLVTEKYAKEVFDTAGLGADDLFDERLFEMILDADGPRILDLPLCFLTEPVQKKTAASDTITRPGARNAAAHRVPA